MCVRLVFSKITKVVKKDGRKDLGEMQPMYFMWWLYAQMVKVYCPKHQPGRNANQLSKDNNPFCDGYTFKSTKFTQNCILLG